MDAPTGTVTLVFTDVQGSTSLWDGHTESMRAAIDLHNRLLRQLLAEAGGFEVKTEGDAFMLAFADPTQALRFCLAAQQALLGADWPAALLAQGLATEERSAQGGLLHRGLRVRMGAHLGQPDCRPDPTTGRMDYLGPVVNRAARVASSAHGGQVVVSASVWKAIEPALSSLGSPATLDLGEFRFEGLSLAEHLYQLLPSSLAERRFAPLKARPTVDTSPYADFVMQDDRLVALFLKDRPSLDTSGRLHGAPPAARPPPPGPVPSSRLPAALAPLELDLPARPPERTEAERWRDDPAAPNPRAPRLPLKAMLLLGLLCCGLIAGWEPLRGWAARRLHLRLPPLSFQAQLPRLPKIELGRLLGGSKPPIKEEALLRVESEPTGAEVRIAGQELGTTPVITQNDFPPGKVEVLVTLEGFQPYRASVEGGTQATVKATLKARR